jgi:hypothetical protein
MKTLIKSLLVAFTLTLINFAFAQADTFTPTGSHNTVAARNKLKNDPTYSTANYKQPNKVTAARQWAPESGIEFRPRNRKPQNITTYREQQRLGGPGDLAIAIPSKGSWVSHNYKQQNLMVVPQPVNNSVVAFAANESVGI